MNLIDKWEGYYEFGEGYSLPHFGERVSIIVNFQGSNETFFGTVKEENSEYSVPLEATIKGFSENDFISFVKKYPKVPILKGSGSTEIMFENGELEIEYQGYIDSKFDSIYGSWSISESSFSETDFDTDALCGTWLLKRAK